MGCHGGVPPNASGKIPSFEMDDDGGYPHEKSYGKRHVDNAAWENKDPIDETSSNYRRPGRGEMVFDKMGMGQPWPENARIRCFWETQP